MSNNIKISASLLSCDFGRIQDEVQNISKAGADLIHLDIMDGHFVPNITIGPEVVKYVKKSSAVPLDVHLMIENVEFYAPKFVEAGADILTFHLESTKFSIRLARYMKSLGVKVGVSLVPSTPASSLEYLIEEVDLILVMTVDPGFAGQTFLSSQIQKIAQIKAMIYKSGRHIDLSVDGGIDPDIAKLCIKAGANILVAGSYIFSSTAAGDYESKMNLLRDRVIVLH